MAPPPLPKQPKVRLCKQNLAAPKSPEISETSNSKIRSVPKKLERLTVRDF
jgi:hypothetical protein